MASMLHDASSGLCADHEAHAMTVLLHRLHQAPHSVLNMDTIALWMQARLCMA